MAKENEEKTPGQEARSTAEDKLRKTEEQPLPREGLAMPPTNSPGSRVGSQNPQGTTNLPKGK